MQINVLSKLGKAVGKVGEITSTKAPLLLSIGGVVGVAGTAYLSYKSAKKVEEIVENIEEYTEEHGVAPSRYEVVRDLAGAVALPVAVGALSIGAIVLSYKIQDGRISALSGALTGVLAERTFYKDKYVQQHGEEEAKKFYSPVTEKAVKIEDEDGNEREIKSTTINRELDEVNGIWFDSNSELYTDDEFLNQQQVYSTIEELDSKFFQKGEVTMNELREAFGFQPSELGALLKWTDLTGFGLEAVEHDIYNERTGEHEALIYLTWKAPKHAYSGFSFGRKARNKKSKIKGIKINR